ncbi:putative methionine transporter (NhaC family) [Vibrio crassostreae]|uniref:Na+/H+ antiporter NhaC family protein n=1 Tax=Vibrio crassostreae TaxID=246167 RepID=UPI001046B8D2|nr:Na+/H+ antiporter NhaC family protein [Vibrio crassostreae]TCN81102.1 putative methionine transporter (NhaC family) [Vibrio crassostreae]CAK2474958.1 putative methionine transporter (NhaC family) [Vibrio crassostreae]CAK2475153.1 putative methionine transporter (NhaC family) [Vibrio crassostreae]CAK3131187.1 putative methionine transporter (NhaC family) [Vibrio crassostreae]CAK3666284.1 putative methionine transporter (NhaC family) [Vibrio crassostreae]
MSNSKNSNAVIAPSAVALIPLIVFLALFIGVGTYLSLQGVDFAFYQLPAPIAALPAVMLALLLSKDKLNRAIEQFLSGVGHKDIIAMCMIYLLAGAFAAVAKASGGVDATVNLGLSAIPTSMILPGIFLISAFIATAMGTSMGTIAAVAPVALGIADSAGMSIPLTAGVVLSGAMFGDNLSIISDTTIAATRSQGCEMRDKFKENIRIALPAALIAIVIFAFNSTATQVPETGPIEWLKVLPYITILILAVSGMNVFVVLTIGILLAGGVSLGSVENYGLTDYAQDIYAGFGNMQEIFLLSMLIGGLSELMRQQGGLAFLTNLVSGLIRAFGSSHSKQANGRASELGIAGLVSMVNMCTANNTVAIIVSGSVARQLAEENNVSPRRSASLLDIFSCVIQGVLPYGAQVLLLGSVFNLSPLEIVSNSYYCFALAIVAVVAVFIKHPARQVAQA